MHDGTSRDATGQDGTSVRTARSGWPPGRDAGGGPLAREAASTANNIDIPADSLSLQGRRGSVVDLDLERRRRLLRDLGLEPVPVCEGVCTCWGRALGGWGA